MTEINLSDTAFTKTLSINPTPPKMALIPLSDDSPPLHHQIHRFPQTQYIDSLRWLPQLSPSLRHLLLSTTTTTSSSSTLHTLSLTPTPTPTLTPLSSLPLPSRITSLKTTPSLIAASTLSGSLFILSSNLNSNGFLKIEAEKGLHFGPILGVDLGGGEGVECVSVGEDGRVCVVRVGEGSERVFDSKGLVSYTAVKWASPVEFVTGGLGFGLQWWDMRGPGGVVSKFKGNWGQKMKSGIVHSVDIHPSRKHTCLAGGSSGTIFAWDLRWQQQPIMLSSAEIGDGTSQAVSESEVWEVQYDNYIHSSNTGSISSSKILPAVMCSEDGILAVVEQGQEPVELLAEPCAINCFDIDKENPSDIICGLEWESLLLLTRP